MADDDRIARIAARLLDAPQPVDDLGSLRPDFAPLEPPTIAPVPAAVLIALVVRPEGYQVLYTKRSPDLRSHSGQVAFPGGKIDADDADAGVAALREAAEEVALVRDESEIIGYLPHYYTGTNYLITPVVAVVRPSAPFVANPLEVQSLFEVPLSLLARDESYGTYKLSRGNVEHTTWKIAHGGEVIWGITANLTRRFKEIALDGEDAF